MSNHATLTNKINKKEQLIMAENNYITKTGAQGNVHISEEVISAIAHEAVREVEGVGGFASSLGGELVERFAKKASSKGVKVTVSEEAITIDVFVLIKYGNVISDVAARVQEAVLSSIEAITGMKIGAVNVTVCGLAFEKNK